MTTRALSVRLPIALALGALLPALSALAAGSCGGPAPAARLPSISASSADGESSNATASASDATTEPEPVDAGSGDALLFFDVPITAEPSLWSLPPNFATCFHSRRCLGVGWTVPPNRLCVRGESDGAGHERLEGTTVRFEVQPHANYGVPVKSLQLHCQARLADGATVMLEADLCIGTKSQRTSHTGPHFVSGVATCRPSALPPGGYTVTVNGTSQSFRIPDLVPEGGACTLYRGSNPWGECPEDRTEDDVRRRKAP